MNTTMQQSLFAKVTNNPTGLPTPMSVGLVGGIKPLHLNVTSVLIDALVGTVDGDQTLTMVMVPFSSITLLGYPS